MTADSTSGGHRGTAARVLRNASLLTAATIGTRLAMFALGVVLARELGPESYGRYGIALALAVVLVPVADAGLTPYVTREVARNRETGEAVLRAALRAKLLLSGLIFAGVGAVSVAVAEGELLAALLLVTLSQLLDGVSAFVYGYFRGREWMGVEARLTTAASFARSLGGIALVLLTGTLAPALVWLAVVALLQVGWSLRRLVWALGAPAGRAVLDWRTAVTMGAIAIFVMVYGRADAVLVGWLVGEAAAGLYTAAYTLLLGLQILPWMIAVALGPVFVRAHATDADLLRRSWSEGLRAILVLSLPLALAPALLADGLLELLFGSDYEEAATALAILVWSTPLAALGAVLTGVLRAGGRERALLVVAAGAAAGNIGANLALIPRYGIEAAAAVTIATEVVGLAAMCAVAVRSGLVPAPRLPLLRLAAALTALTAVAVAGVPGGVAATGLAAGAAYAAVLVATRVVGPRELALLREARRR